MVGTVGTRDGCRCGRASVLGCVVSWLNPLARGHLVVSLDMVLAVAAWELCVRALGDVPYAS